DRGRGVRELARAPQRRMRESAAAAVPAPIHPLLPLRHEPEIAADQLQVRSDRDGVIENAPGRIRVRDYGWPTRPEYPGFLPSYGLAGIAKVVHVIEIHGSQHGAVGVERVDRVEPPAEAHLEDHGVEGTQCEDLPGRQRAELEICQRDLPSRTLDFLEGRAKAIVVDRDAA